MSGTIGIPSSPTGRMRNAFVVVLTSHSSVVLSATVQMAERYALRWRPDALASRHGGRR